MQEDEPEAARYLDHILDDFLAKARVRSDDDDDSDDSDSGSDGGSDGGLGRRRLGGMGLFKPRPVAAVVEEEDGEGEGEVVLEGAAEGAADEDVEQWFRRHEYLGVRGLWLLWLYCSYQRV